ncbi:MAG: molybdenum cofactor carrier protein [Akkermansiaceae bacterium]|nr:molybdenum cofactor carrier protein [Akkermansiaceae bacterium]
MNKLPVVGVMGSGSDPHDDAAMPLGKLLAALGVHLLTGGGGGVMRSVSGAFVRERRRAGLCLGVLPGEVDGAGWAAPGGYPNEFVEIVIRTHLPGRGKEGGAKDSRNWINVLSSDAVIILPGGDGTECEARIARELGKPAISFGGVAAPEGIAPALTLSEVERFLRIELKLGR